jgi:hypothetical protein
MGDKDVHYELIRMLLDGYARSEAEFAAANEIRTLRQRIAELEAERQAPEVVKPARAKKA